MNASSDRDQKISIRGGVFFSSSPCVASGKRPPIRRLEATTTIEQFVLKPSSDIATKEPGVRRSDWSHRTRMCDLSVEKEMRAARPMVLKRSPRM